MTRLPRIVTLLGSGLLLAACGQLIGLGDYESVDGEGGEAGEETGGRSGRGGRAGSGGTSGEATAGSGDRGGTGGSTGGSAGSGGTAGELPGTGGSAGSTGGTGSNEGGAAGDAGSGGEAGEPVTPGCRELTSLTRVKTTVDETEGPAFVSTQYAYEFLPNLGSSLGDELLMEFYQSEDEGLDGAASGTFELGTDIDINFETCARCLRVFQDLGSTALEKVFFATSGTLTIAPDSLQMQGFPYMSFRDVTLVEVTIDDNVVSTPVPGGDCLHFDSLEYNQPPPPPEWTCVGEYYVDFDCDCGCGAIDSVCESPYAASCDYCLPEGGSCAATCDDLQVDDNAVCVSPQPWTCGYFAYADGVCDCGCGITDIDCTDGSFASCEACHCPSGVTDTSCEGATVDPADNSLCLP